MRNIDVVGYGNLLTIDGFRGKAHALADPSDVTALLAELGELLDPGAAQRSRTDEGLDGVSAALVSAESQLSVHTFPEFERMAFRAFSRRILPVITLSERVRVRFALGRLESQLRHRATLIPDEETVSMSRVLAGERAYARLRLGDVLSR